MENKIKVPFFTKGDIGGMAYLIPNNIVNYLIVIITLSNVLGWPDDLVYGKVIPGMSIGLMLGCFYYAYMAKKLAIKENRTDVTALPSGLSTPAMFIILYGVITPLHYALGDPYITWAAALAATFIGGATEFVGGFIGPWMKKKLPRAALLGTVAGIGFIWMATQGLFDIYSDPLLGLPIFGIAMLGLFGGYLFPKKVPPLVVAIVGGIIYALALGKASFDFSGVGFYFPNPVNTLQALASGFAVVLPYLTIIIPIEIYNFIETMDNVESANAAGDNYSVREAQFADGICTMVVALFGGIVPNTVWLGHAGLKKTKAGIGYSVVSGLILGFAGIFGLFSFLSALIPQAVCAITFLWCAIVMVAQAFKATKTRHYAAVAIAMIPPVADYMFTQISGAISLTNTWAETLGTGLTGYSPEITQQILDAGVMWNGVPAVKAGAILIGIIMGTMTVFIIDHELDKAAITMLVGALLSATGFIHFAQLGLHLTSPFTIGYVVVAALLYVFHLGSKTWFKYDEDFEYV
jgi:AGZA family xanthine/uracil permease-like MFS transporter